MINTTEVTLNAPVQTCLPSWIATIWIGRKVSATGRLTPEYEVRNALQAYVERGACVSLTRTEFLYKGGSEPGFVVGLIQYPRFPKELSALEAQALELGALLRKVCNQERCSIVMPDKTVMLSDPPETESH